MQKFLHVGCGPFKKNQTTKGFNNEKWKEIRLDIDKEYSPDILGTIKDLSSIENNSIDLQERRGCGGSVMWGAGAAA